MGMTEETLPTLVVGVFVLLWFWGGFVCLVVLLSVFGFLFFGLSPFSNTQSFHPSHDDLGTPPTRRPYSCKKYEKLLPTTPAKEGNGGGSKEHDTPDKLCKSPTLSHKQLRTFKIRTLGMLLARKLAAH